MGLRKNRTASADVIILGAGASGLMCARAASARGIKVMVLDHGPKAGRKVLASGGGHCNYTNLHADHTHYLGQNPHFTRSALARFSPQDVLGVLESHGIKYIERDEGQIFLATGAAKIVEALLADCRAAGTRIVLGAQINSVARDEGGFRVDTSAGTYSGGSLVVATGGKSWDSLGATGIGYRLANQFGHNITELRPGLTSFVLGARNPFAALDGISFRAELSTRKVNFCGDVLITHRGLSGPAVLQISSYWQKGDALRIRFMPGQDIGQWLEHNRRSRAEFGNLLAGRLPRRLAHGIALALGVSGPMNSLPGKSIQRIARELESFELIPEGIGGFNRAEVTVGGVDTRRISSRDMQSQLVPGLYFTGEVLDVTGHLGGFNLHWAWVSALAAAEGLVGAYETG